MYDLTCISSTFDVIVDSIEYLNLQWNRRYFESGDFSFQILQDHFDERIKYVIRDDRPEVGIVERIESMSDITGDYLQVSGHFMERQLSRDVIKPRMVASGKPSDLSKNVVSTYAVNFPAPLVLAEEHADTTDEKAIEVDYVGQELDDATYALLKPEGKSQRILFDDENKRFVYQIWSGVDRTQDQADNPFALFSDTSSSDEIKITEDESGYKNYAVVLLKDDKIIEYDGRTDHTEGIRTKFIDCSSSSPAQDQTQEQFESACIQKAKDELSKWPKIRNVEIDPSQDRLRYPADYDLGDVCDIVNHRLRKSYKSRIIEVYEVVKEGQFLVDVVFGDKIPSNYERVKNR